jgi:hypothetical protein
MAPVAASASASTSEQPDLVRGNSDGNDSAAIPKKRGQSAGLLDDDSEAKEVKRERNRVHAQLSRSRKKAHMQQLEQEVAAYRAAAYHGAELLDEQWAALNNFLKWFRTSATCSQEQWSAFADEKCLLWLPLGDVAYNETAGQHNSTVVCFTGADKIGSHGRQHFLQNAVTLSSTTSGTAAAATAAGNSSHTSALMDINCQGDALSNLQFVVDRHQMYTRCSNITAAMSTTHDANNCSNSSSSSSSSNLSHLSAQFMCNRQGTKAGSVLGAAVCTFMTDTESSQQRLISVNLLYDTCAMSRLLSTITTR